MLNIPSLILVWALAAVPARAQAAAARAASYSDIEVKVALESALEKRLETVLRKVLGSGDVFVVANAELLADTDRPEVEVLPGVTVKQTPASPAPLEMPASLVKRMTLSVFVGRSMSEADIDLARKTAERMVGLKPERGDVLNVEKAGPPPEPDPRLGAFLKQALTPKTILLLAWLAAACWGLLRVSRGFLDPCLSVLREAVQNLSRTGAEGAAARGEPDVPSDAPAAPAAAFGSNGAASSERKLPFCFIMEGNLPALDLLLVEQSDMASAIIVQYLPASLASRTLAAMTPAKREKVLSLMSSATLLDQAEVKKIEEAVLSKIDYIMGGEDKLVALLEGSSIAMQAEILSSVRRRDSELGRRLERRVVVIEDIGRLDEAGLTALSRQATVRGMAVVLKSSALLREKVLPKLKSGLGEWLSQETALIADLPEHVKDLEMRRVLDALVKLVREGKIVLRKDAPPAVGVAANGAAAKGS